eukprot:11422686-Alexandrium_andersonii.AAC.1
MAGCPWMAHSALGDCVLGRRTDIAFDGGSIELARSRNQSMWSRLRWPARSRHLTLRCRQ